MVECRYLGKFSKRSYFCPSDMIDSVVKEHIIKNKAGTVQSTTLSCLPVGVSIPSHSNLALFDHIYMRAVADWAFRNVL